MAMSGITRRQTLTDSKGRDEQVMSGISGVCLEWWLLTDSKARDEEVVSRMVYNS